MSGPDAGALALKRDYLKPVKLPLAGLSIYQDSRFQSVTHASAFLQQEIIRLYSKPGLRVLELGSGCGIVSIMLALQRPDWQITGLEIQEQEVLLARQNALMCRTGINFIHADLRQWQPDGDYDLIVSNPPWMPVRGGLSSPLLTRRIGREELCCNMDDLLSAIQRFSGAHSEAMLIYPLARRKDLENRLQKSSLDTIQVLISSDFKLYFISQILKVRNNI